MRNSSIGWFVGVLALVQAPFAHAQVAGSVISYNAGTGAAAGFNDPTSALGMPSTFTVHQFGGPVDPYDPPFLASQLVSIGAGGSLTLQLSSPISHDASHAFGMDFIIYGNSGFVIDDFNAMTTSGELFGAAAQGSTEVSVSADNVTFYRLSPTLAPTVDRLFPTDGSGTFGLPVNPNLTAADIAGKNLDGIRALYNGSGGGAAFDLGWARDGGGNPVSLDSVSYIRINVLSGAAEIDGVVATPEPATIALLALGSTAMLWRKKRA